MTHRNSEGGLESSSVSGHSRIRWEQYEQPCVAIVESIARITGREPTALPRLGRYVDTDAVDALVEGVGRSVLLTFEYDDLLVSIGVDGTIVVTPAAADGIDAGFEAVLRNLLRSAEPGGVSVGGSYEIRSGRGFSDWEVQITELQKPDDADR